LASCEQPGASQLFNTRRHLHHLHRILACTRESENECVCAVLCCARACVCVLCCVRAAMRRCAAVWRGSRELRRTKAATAGHGTAHGARGLTGHS